MKRFENKAALVTGAAKGIGFATAERLCAEGASVVVADYDLEGAKKACQTLNDAGGNAVAVYFNAAELEKAVFITLKKQMEAAASLNPDGTVRLEVAVPERSEYEQQIEELQDGKRLLYERYLLGEIDLDTYKAEKTACDELLLKTKNAYAAVLAQAKQKQEERSRQESREEAAEAILDADTLTTELADFLIDRVLVYPDNRIEIAYKIKDIFD